MTISLKPDRTITLTSQGATYRGQLTARNPDQIYRFNLDKSSEVRIQHSGFGFSSKVELIRDANHNARLDAGEIMRTAIVQNETPGSFNLPKVSAGTYFLRVSLSRGNFAEYAMQASAAVSTSQKHKSSNGKIDAFINRVFQLTNVFRQQNQLQPLTYSSHLASAAQTHSQNMALQDFFSHIGQDGSTSSSRILSTGYQYSWAAENIAAGYTTPEAVVQGWIDSPSHRVNLLNSNLKEIGIGHYFLARDTGNVNYHNYWTQVFATPK
jgi:uncharacterized protein YkwD